jgi:hypothetical protein
MPLAGLVNVGIGALPVRPRNATTTAAQTTPIVSSTTETTVATLAIPANVAAGDIVRFGAYGDTLNNSGGAAGLIWKLKLGATTVLTMSSLSLASNANRRQWFVQAELNVIDPAASQWMGVFALVSANSASSWPIGTGTSTGGSSAAATVDLTAGVSLVLTGTVDVNNASTDVRFNFATLKV